MSEHETNSYNEPIKYLRELAMECKTCAAYHQKLQVVWESPKSGAMTASCPRCGTTMHLPYIPPQSAAGV